LTACQNAKRELAKIPNIKVLSRDNSSVVCFTTTDEINPIALGDLLEHDYSWILNKTMFPNSLHIAVTLATCDRWEELVQSVKKAIAAMKTDKSLNHSSSCALYGLAGQIPDSRFTEKFIGYFFEASLDTI